jgi:hypothetical protein
MSPSHRPHPRSNICQFDNGLTEISVTGGTHHQLSQLMHAADDLAYNLIEEEMLKLDTQSERHAENYTIVVLDDSVFLGGEALAMTVTVIFWKRVRQEDLEGVIKHFFRELKLMLSYNTPDTRQHPLQRTPVLATAGAAT